MQATPSTPDQLAALLDGRSDAEIVNACNEQGIDTVLDAVFEAMVTRFVPAQASGVDAVVTWNLETPIGMRSYALTVRGGQCSMQRGAGSSLRVGLTATIPVFLRIIAGRLNGLQAFSDGALRVTGEAVLALKQQLWFGVDMSQAGLKMSKPSELARVLEGRSDEELEAGVELTGIDTALDQVFRGMVEQYLPHKGPRKRSIVAFSVRTSAGDRLYQFIADPHGAAFERGSKEKPDVTLMMRSATFLRIVSGKLDGLIALAQGKIKFRGNILLARKVQSWFDMSG